jgi:hypothetical protein
LVREIGIEAIFAIFPLFLFAAFLAFFALFAAVAHDVLPINSLTNRRRSSAGEDRSGLVNFPGAIEGGLDVGHDVFAAHVVEEARLLKQL